MKKKSNGEVFVITPWGCLSSILHDYSIDASHITGKMGEHLVDDFMAAMVKAGYIRASKKEEDEFTKAGGS